MGAAGFSPAIPELWPSASDSLPRAFYFSDKIGRIEKDLQERNGYGFSDADLKYFLPEFRLIFLAGERIKYFQKIKELVPETRGL